MFGSYGQMLIPQKPRGNVPEYKRQGGVYVPGSAGVPPVSDAPGQIMANAAKAASSMEGATGESIGKLAGATANAVKVGVKAYEDYQAAKAQQAFNSYQAEEMKLRAELGTLQGENALGEHGVMARLEQWRNEARSRLVENLAPIARDLFDRHSSLLDARTDAWAIQKQYRENIAFQNSASEGSIANAFALALEQPLDDAAQGSALGIVKAELERMGQRSGWDSSLVQSKLRTAAQKLEGDRIEALIAAGNLDAAQSVLDKAGQTGGKADIRGMPSEVEKLVRQAAKKYGVREDLALAMVMQESGGNQNAVSKAGAIGPTQLMPPTARDLGVNPYDLAENIDGGVSYLAQQLQKFGNETDALTAYNWGPGNMQKHIKGGRSGPMPKEAREYAMRVYGRMGLRGMDPVQKMRWQHRIDLMRKSQQAELRADLGMRINDYVAACMDGRDYEHDISDGQIVAAYGEKSDAVLRRVHEAGQLKDYIARMNDSDAEGIADIIKSFSPDTARDGYADKRKLIGILEQKAQQIMTAREKDPTGYLLRRNPALRDAYNTMLRELNPENAKAYLAGRQADAEVLGMGEVPIFPQGQAQNIANSIMQSADPVASIKGLSSAFGSDWRSALQELCAKDCLPAVAQLAINGMPRSDAKLMLLAAKDRDFLGNAWALGKDRFTETDFKSEVLKQTQDFNSTLLAGGDSTMAAEINHAVTLLGLQYALGGLDYKDAIEKAAAVVVGDHYSINSVNGGSFRVPMAFDGDLIERGAAVALNELAQNIGDLFVSDRKDLGQMANKLYASQIRYFSRWVTSGDESGLMLFSGNNVVRDKDGAPVMRTWEELGALAKKWHEDEKNRYDSATEDWELY